MTTMTTLTILITKFITFLLRLARRNAGNVPGRVALKLQPGILKHLKITGKIVVITGTNGKTTTTSMLAKVLQQADQKVIYNTGGNNISWGIATTLLQAASPRGRISCDYLLLETDEHWVPVLYASKNLAIDTLIVLDFFRDQLDRAGEMETIIAKIEKFVKKHPCNLILNGDDPNVVRIGRANQRGQNFYYGLAELPTSYRTSHDKMEGLICPYCKTPLIYDFYQYSHLGRFHCPNCDYQNAPLTLQATAVSDHAFTVASPAPNNSKTASAQLQAQTFTTTNSSLYNLYNLLAILTFVHSQHLDPAAAVSVFATYENQNGRHQTFEISGRPCTLDLCKNPTGYNVILRPLKHKTEAKELLLVLNDHVNDGFDVSWIWDIDFSDLAGFDRIVCSGTRAFDMAIPLKCNGFDPAKIIVEHSIEKAIHRLLKTRTHKYIISNYSPLMQVKQTLAKLEKNHG